MRYVLENQKEVKIKAENAYSYVMKRFNYTVVENLFTTMIKELYG